MGGITLTVPYKPPEAVTPSGAPYHAGLGRLRKIALIGNAPTVHHAPWHDQSWEIWAHASSAPYVQRVDRYFDLHPKKFWAKGKRWSPDYAKWLARLETPVYMQRRYHDVPRSVRYPHERIVAEFPWRYFTSQAAWMIALALTEGVTHLGFYGIHYSSDAEHAAQRAGCEFWMGIAIGRGVHLAIPEGNPLLREPALLYGYESHSSGKLDDSYKLSFAHPTASGPAQGKTLHPTSQVRLMDLGVPVDWKAGGYPDGYTEPVKGEDAWPIPSEGKGRGTTMSRSAQRRAKSASSRAKRPRAKSAAGSRSRTR